MLLIGIEPAFAIPVARAAVGADRATLLKLMLAARGTVPALLYTSFPWMRSYMMPYPPRITVLPFPLRSYAKPRRGPKFFQASFTQPLGIPAAPALTDAVYIELAGQCGIRAGAKSWAGRANSSVTSTKVAAFAGS